LHALFVVLALLDMRRSEALGLRWEDVDLDQGGLRVRRSLHRIGGKLTVLPTRTQQSGRTVPLPAMVTRALRDHQARQDRERTALSARWPNLGYVFTTPIGTQVDPRNRTG
jgi:integrase